MKVKLIAIALIVQWLASAAHALSMGELETKSTLGQPLSLSIMLTTEFQLEIDSLNVKLADQTVFSQRGLQYPEQASSFRFNLNPPEGNQVELEITSTENINSADLNLLLQLDWIGGNILRDYVVKLRPLGSQGVQQRSTEVLAKSISTVDSMDNAVIVQPGESLSVIANRYRSGDVSMQQAWVAFYNQNKQAFPTGNIDLLAQGVKLNIPSPEQMLALTRTSAIEQVRKLSPSSRSSDVAQGQGAPQIAQNTLQIGVDADVVQSPASGSGATEELLEQNAGELAAIRTEMNSFREEMVAARGENVVLSERLNQVESQLGKIGQLLEMQNQTLGVLNNQAQQQLQASVENTEQMARPNVESPQQLTEATAEQQLEQGKLENEPLNSSDSVAEAQIESTAEVLSEAGEILVGGAEALQLNQQQPADADTATDQAAAALSESEEGAGAGAQVSENATAIGQQSVESLFAESEQLELDDISSEGETAGIQSASAESLLEGENKASVSTQSSWDKLVSRFSDLPEGFIRLGLYLLVGLLALLGLHGLIRYNRRQRDDEMQEVSRRYTEEDDLYDLQKAQNLNSENVELELEQDKRKDNDIEGYDLSEEGDLDLDLLEESETQESNFAEHRGQSSNVGTYHRSRDVEEESISYEESGSGFVGRDKQGLDDDEMSLFSHDDDTTISVGQDVRLDQADNNLSISNNRLPTSSRTNISPLAKAQVYLAHGYKREAMKMLQSAYDQSPSNQKIALELLRHYADENNKTAFVEVLESISEHKKAGTIYDQWEQIEVIAQDYLPEYVQADDRVPVLTDEVYEPALFESTEQLNGARSKKRKPSYQAERRNKASDQSDVPVLSAEYSIDDLDSVNLKSESSQKIRKPNKYKTKIKQPKPRKTTAKSKIGVKNKTVAKGKVSTKKKVAAKKKLSTSKAVKSTSAKAVAKKKVSAKKAVKSTPAKAVAKKKVSTKKAVKSTPAKAVAKKKISAKKAVKSTPAKVVAKKKKAEKTTNKVATPRANKQVARKKPTSKKGVDKEMVAEKAIGKHIVPATVAASVVPKNSFTLDLRDEDADVVGTTNHAPDAALSLARAYVDLGEEEIAKDFLNDVIASDDATLVKQAENLLKGLK